jgi:ribosomal protein L11 methylase PrmA
MFERNGELYRAVNQSYKSSYDHLLSSSLYTKLVELNLMIPFKEVDSTSFNIPGVYKLLKPEQIKFISYPYEWAFSMLKDAALLTLKIQALALDYGMSLKDASAFNVQFRNGKPVFIDTLSFELYTKNQPWIAYRQFCQHFLAPLALMAHVDPALNRLFIPYIDGIPLDLAKRILPFRSRFNIGLYLHVFLHSKAQKKHENSTIRLASTKRKFSVSDMRSLVEGLKSSVKSLKWNSNRTEWIDYTDNAHKQEYTDFKTKIVSDWLEELKPEFIWDLGANTGHYSRLSAKNGTDIISFDFDPACVERNYNMAKTNNETKITPLFLDLLNASPGIGWGGTERLSFYERKLPDLLMALALIHHLAISANITFEMMASNFSRLSKNLIIEFVPKEDEKVKILLLNRKDIFEKYTVNKFESSFSKYYHISQKIPSNCNERIFYLMKRK